jgi:hypothetical protein
LNNPPLLIYAVVTGPDVGGLILKEEKDEQEVPGGPQGTSFEELNLSKASPGGYSAYKF